MPPPAVTAYRNLIEPRAYLELFSRFPPIGFDCRVDDAGFPVFFTPFSLLTTLEPRSLARLRRLPFFAALENLLSFQSCFIGTTITEYAPLPAHAAPSELVAQVLRAYGKRQSLAIIKDIPLEAPFLSPEDTHFARQLAEEARAGGFIEVEGQALAYVPVDFDSMDAYMAGLSASRRKDLRRKLKKRGLLDIEAVPFGSACFSDRDFLDRMYAMYLAVYEQSEIHFDKLSRDYFAALLQQRDSEGFVFLYRYKRSEEDSCLAAFNICLVHERMLIDKYIGFSYPLARELNLYFISWMVNLEYALEKGLKLYIAGWTDPEVKASLGARFAFTRHLVWVRNPILRVILKPLRRFFESDRRVLEGMQ